MTLVLVPMRARRGDIARFLSNVAARPLDNECWLWPYGRNSQGYGVVYVDGKQIVVHRWSYRTFIGEIPSGLELDHLCRNRGCLNPLHLEPVTRRENILRGVGSPARFAQRTCCPKCGGPFGIDGEGLRRCLPCRRAQEAAYKADPRNRARYREAQRVWRAETRAHYNERARARRREKRGII
jgi:Zn-finger nucleic acid-binding protein